MSRKKKDLQFKISVCKDRIKDLNDAIEGKLYVSRYEMGEMISRYISPSERYWPTESEMIDPETRWLAMMQYMAETLSELRFLKEELAAMESKSNCLPLPMIPFFDQEAAEDELRFVSSYVEWRCMR